MGKGAELAGPVSRALTDGWGVGIRVRPRPGARALNLREAVSGCWGDGIVRALSSEVVDFVLLRIFYIFIGLVASRSTLSML